ncbi:amidohydrolase family protein [Telmatospirillum siberiense]|uniref:Amidohydrolase n=1 Tax=Telmatospirillum siberiense TaxID=382514 RepID=A0A2N3PUW9_9PROT|nr:amidohydrolase family protein [Telmatospirillum siberiense]PKU24203.1 amidohydrolase [Telmatospirillum siberiense]
MTIIVHGQALLTTRPDGTVAEHRDVGVVVEGATIAAILPFDGLTRRYPDVRIVGDGRDVILPGFVNAHHHVGLTPLQLGSPDMPLELWWITRMLCRAVDPYLDTLYGAFDMISSGITTVQHIHGWVPGTLDTVAAASENILRAYDDVGMRVSYCYAVREQNRLVYQDDAAFVDSLPRDLQGPMRSWFDRFRTSLDDMIALFEQLHERHGGKSRTRIQLAPANLHWCSDKALDRIALAAEGKDVRLHMHLLETAYQKEYARRRANGASAVEHLQSLGLLGPRMTLGHGTWLNQTDIELVARTGTCICHNCSSNMRLRSGLAPLNHFKAAGITTAIGLDEAGINDDRDMFQEMRLVLRAHRTPGMDDTVPTTADVFRMATTGGAQTTDFAGAIGSLEVGKAADLVLLDWDGLSQPYLDPLTGRLDAVVQRGRRDHVRTVVCDGRVIFDGGRFTQVDQAAAMRQLHDQLQSALSNDEVERRKLSQALLPHVRRFYARYVDPSRHEPFYRQSSRL